MFYRSILVGTDGSETARTAVLRATELARTLSAKLLIVSVYEPVPAGRARRDAEAPADEQWLVRRREEVLGIVESAAVQARGGGAGAVETFVCQGDAADAIIDVAEEQACDLIVVGNRGMTGARRFLLGSVPNRVSHHAPCSVLIVRTV